MPNPFGQAADYSGVFASLGREQISAIATATRQAANQSATDQNAVDQDTYSKWKAGQITDQQWLDYIRQRLAAAGGDPTEQQKWADLLRTNEAAISDAQAETQFKLGKISAQALLSHYRERMAGVATDSPAYRDLADRYQQLVDYVKGGTSGSSGSGSGGASIAAYIKAQQAKSSSASTPAYNPSGPDVIVPASNYYGTGSVSYYLKTLLADRDRIRDLVDQYKVDPTLTYLTDHMTGAQIPVSPEMLHALDNQYLRNQDAIATVYDAQNKPFDATKARTDKGSYVSTYMADHNTDRIEPAYTALQNTIVDAWKTASNLPPDQRLAVYQQTDKMIKQFEDGAFPGEAGVGLKQIISGQTSSLGPASGANPELAVGGLTPTYKTADLPPELKASAALLNTLRGWELLHQAVIDPNLSDQERQMLGEEAIKLIPGSIDPTNSVATRGERGRLSSSDVQDLLYGDPNIPSRKVSASSQLGAGFTGAFAALEQMQGLDNRDPSYDGQRFVYQIEPDGTAQVVPAKSWPNADGSLTLTPLATVDRSGLIQTVVKMGGATHIAYATAQTIPANLLPKEALVYRAANTIVLPANSQYKSVPSGGLIPSDVIKSMGGMGWLNQQIRQGNVVADSPFRGVVIQGDNGPVIWYQDPKTGLLSSTIDLKVSQPDPITGGLSVSVDDSGIAKADINDVPFATGSPIAFGDGFSRKEMLAIVKDQMASGQIDPSQFSVRGAGTSVAGAATADDIIKGFGPAYPTATELAQSGEPTAQISGWGRGHLSASFDKHASDAAVQWKAADTMAQAREGQPLPSPVQDVIDSVSRITGAMGIQIKPLEAIPGLTDMAQQAPAQQDLGAMARNDALEAMRARQAQMAQPKPVLQPIFTPPKVNYAPLPVRKQDTGGLTTPTVNPTPVLTPPSQPQTIGIGRYAGKKIVG